MEQDLTTRLRRFVRTAGVIAGVIASAAVGVGVSTNRPPTTPTPR